MNCKYALFLFLSLLFNIYSYGQTYEGEAAKKIIPIAKTVQIGTQSAVPTFVVFEEENQIPIHEFAAWEKKTFQYDEEVSFITTKTVEGKAGFSHQFREQYYNDIPVEHSLSVVHSQDDKVIYFNGNTHNEFSLNTLPALNDETAQDIALRHLNIDPEDWRYVKLKATNYLLGGHPSNKTELLKQNLIVYPYEGQYHLAWKIHIISNHFSTYNIVYVDAHNSIIINTIDAVRDCNFGTANTSWRGVQPFFTDLTGGTTFILRDDCLPSDIRTINEATGADFTSTTNTWNPTAIIDIGGITTHWAVSEAFDYFLNTHAQIGLDNGDMDGIGVVDVFAVPGLNNATFTPGTNTLRFGLGTSSTTTNDDYTTLDVAGHEYAHGVLENTGGITAFVHETNALHEGIADIFGDQVEAFADGAAPEYSMGEEITGGSTRLMSNPNADTHSNGNVGSPDTYQGDFWSGSSEHVDGGVIRYWFFLLSEGGSGTNDNNDVYEVPGVGNATAAAILYEAVFSGAFGAAPDYNTARNATIQAAITLFGECTPEHGNVINAWHAVGVGFEAFPDISIGSLQVSGSNSIPVGGSLGVTYNITANNQVYFDNSTIVGFYILSYCPGSNGLSLPYYAEVESISCGSTTNTGAYLTLPTTISPGNYYIVAKVDAYNSLVESNELNNSTCVRIRVTGEDRKLPDFIPERATVSPSTVQAGATIQRSVTLSNIGDAYGGYSYMCFYLSTNPTYSNDDVYLGNTLSLPLNPGGSITSGGSLTIPAGTTPGNYYIIFRADCYGWHLESNENNNTTYASITVLSSTGELPDLTIDNVNPPPSGAPPLARVGQYISVQYELINLFPNSSPAPSATRVFLSTDDVVSPDDLIVLTSYNQLPGTKTAVFSIPGSATVNQYYRVLIVADYFDGVTEVVESNNIGISHVVVYPGFRGDDSDETRLESQEASKKPIKKDLRIFPNPTKDQFTVRYTVQEKPINISLFNSTGQQIDNQSLLPKEQTGQWQYVGEQLPSGLYYLQWHADDQTEMLKIIVE
ncbi:MAG: M4 family metallopeptidase [Bacteroidota bacterium]